MIRLILRPNLQHSEVCHSRDNGRQTLNYKIPSDFEIQIVLQSFFEIPTDFKMFWGQ